MKREVPIAQFFPLEAPCSYAANRKGLALDPGPALHLTTQPQTLNCVMKYIFIGLSMVQSYTHVLLIYDKCL